MAGHSASLHPSRDLPWQSDPARGRNLPHPSPMNSGNDNTAALRDEIADLEARLQQARSKLPANPSLAPAATATATHFLLLLSDSALPLGSFAFSSGLESYIAHQHGPRPHPRQSVERFLRLSLHSLSASTLPFVIAAHQNPAASPLLDDTFDASTTCAVARRASVSQGRALLSVFEKSFSPSSPSAAADRDALESYRLSLRAPAAAERSSGHFGVAWGLVCRACGLDLDAACYLFLFGHAKAALSAAVRQSLVGPYQAQALLAAAATRERIVAGLELGARISVDEAGQRVPTFDIYQGRHELLYSRVFNS